jgi:hypothetical protein
MVAAWRQGGEEMQVRVMVWRRGTGIEGLFEVDCERWFEVDGLRLGVFRIRSATVSPAEIPAESPGIYSPRRRLFLYPTRAYAHKGYTLSNLKTGLFLSTVVTP